MTKSQTSRLAVIAVIAGSLLAVGVVTAFSIVKQADAQFNIDLSLRNRATQSNTATTTQSINDGGGTCTVCSNTATTTQSNTATQGNSISVTLP
jgi:hypothetical protein